MKISEMIEKLNLKILTGDFEDCDVKFGYVSDMLSDVMGHAPSESALITILAHENVIAVAMLRDISIIILANNRMPDKKTIEKSCDENIIIGVTQLSAFETAGILYNNGVSGKYE
ncbi:MAG: serine kinase [Candidatus Muirbacterium halophilum]|nr:serine kinase [Candidatus Muirbacterium halophilum]MCK9475074.1 serine kinase [Candidatus Muirbacterium halophilum]